MSKEHIEKSLDIIRGIFEKASEKIDKIKPGDTYPATTLANELAESYNMQGPSLYPVLKFLYNGYPGIIVRKGSRGGLYRPIQNNNSSMVTAAENTSMVTAAENTTNNMIENTQ